MKIISNNPLVQEKYPSQTEYIDSDVKTVLIKARDYIHLGAKLLNHPLSGTLPYGEAVYSSLVIKEQDTHSGVVTDFYSLAFIDDAIAKFNEPPKRNRNYDTQTLEDLKVLDFDMLNNCIQKLQ